MKSVFPRPFLFALFALLCCISCQREITPPIDLDIPVPNITINTSISGRITSDGVPLSGVQVKAGNTTALTDENGIFLLDDASVLQQTAFVNASKEGYFPGIRTFVASTEAVNYIEIDLLEKELTGSFSTTTGGNISVPGGSVISFSPNSIVTESGNPYSGSVNVYAHYLSPEDEDLSLTMPGDLRGINADGDLTGMITYGMLAVEITGTSGEKLQVAPGKKAVLEMPISVQQAGTAPASIPLWYFDETTGLWKEEGVAVKQNGKYVGEVSHFSYWNCDVPANFIYFNTQLTDQNGNALPYTTIRLTDEKTGSMTTGTTDASGKSKGWVPKGVALKMEVLNKCNKVLFTEQIGPFIKDANLGTKVVTIPANAAITISGTVNNCGGDPLENGIVQIYLDGLSYAAKVNEGAFSLVVYGCSFTPTEVELIPVDNGGAQPVFGDAVTLPVTSGTVDAGTLEACNGVATEFLRFKIDGTDYDFYTPIDSINFYAEDTLHMISVSRRSGDQTYLQVQWSGMATTGTKSSMTIAFQSASDGAYFTPQAGFVPTITEYGPVGGFVAGNYTGTASGDSSGTSRSIQLSFKIKRRN